jgi:hypothetical protein
VEAGIGGGPCTDGVRDSCVRGLESKLGRESGALDRRGMGWSRLCPGHRRGLCFGVPSWDTLVRESPRDAVQHDYDLAS